ncbi:immunoglobulin superfamily member 5 isoform X8 [Trachemys scripta elegans]|uniref:immunoglobulin superfamily member 5 isoform X8 n=1 Tax=Trachemys scripta elegans TaxID=31138 RepID=UPI0015582BC8|nr:immunoglobulin superfamily member 5 isoform X8 [Trachemys scripta elegans]
MELEKERRGRGTVMTLPNPDQLSAYQQAGLRRHHGTEPIKLVSGENAPMDNLQKFIPVTFILFASLTGFGFGYSIIKGPVNATVLAGSEARFNCTVSQGWQIIIWLLNGNAVLTTTHAGGAVVTMVRFTQQNYTSGENFTSELIIHNVQQNDSGKIECSIQTGVSNSYAFLSVQESTYQKELRKVSTKKTSDGSVKTRRSSGNENSGYSPEDPVYTKQMPRIAPLPPMASNFHRTEEDLEVSSPSEISTHVRWQSSQVPRSSRSLPYHTSISPVHHLNHHRQQPKTQNYKRQQTRTPHLRIIYPRTLQSRSQHPHTRTLYRHKYQHRHQHPHTTAWHPRTQQLKSQHLQTNKQQIRSQHPQPRIHQPQGQQIKNPPARTKQFGGQQPQSRYQKSTGQNPQLVMQKPKDSHM